MEGLGTQSDAELVGQFFNRYADQVRAARGRDGTAAADAALHHANAQLGPLLERVAALAERYGVDSSPFWTLLGDLPGAPDTAWEAVRVAGQRICLRVKDQAIENKRHIRVVSRIGDEVRSMVGTLLPGVMSGEPPMEIPNLDRPVLTYGDATLRIVASMQCYGRAATHPPDTEDRRRELEAANRAMPTQALMALARVRNELPAIMPIVTALGLSSTEVGKYLAMADSPAERFPDPQGTATRLILGLGTAMNMLQPFVIEELDGVTKTPTASEQQWVYQDERTRRVPWDENRDGFISLGRAMPMLLDEATRLGVKAPTPAKVGALLDSCGNPVRHMKLKDTGGGRGNRKVLASDVEKFSRYLLGMSPPDPADIDPIGVSRQIEAPSKPPTDCS